MKRPIAVSLLLTFLFAGAAEASWYDDYEEGIAAARAGNWNAVVTKMTAAIRGNGNENNKARTYGAIFINYHPYYYRGVAYVNLGRYEQGIADLEKTSGPGELDLGPIGQHLDRAKRMLAAAQAPEPEPPRVEPTRPAVTTPVPAVPQIDPNLRQRAANALNTAKQKIQEAQGRRATTSPQYAQAMSAFTEASSRNASAKSNEDLNVVITMAGNAADFAELAMPPTAPTVATTTPTPAVTPRPVAATSTVMADYTGDVRRALEYYFAGEFEDATRYFEDLSRKMPDNGWIWAFLGASQYSQYAFEADEAYRDAALKSFQRARTLRRWDGGLPAKYFSKKIRKAFSDNAG
jgi:tetratricopeptide (TPR) repeat protein